MAEKEETVSPYFFSEEEQRSGLESYNAFQQSQFDSCIATLKKIQKNRPDDTKLMHNRAIAEFYKSNQTKTGDLKRALSKVHKVAQQSHQDDDADEILEEVASNEYSVLHYNQALLYYFLHQYSEAQTLLEALADNPEVTHNAKEIFLLLAEVYLSNFESEKAGCLLNKIKETFLKPTTPQSKQSAGNDGKEKGKSQKSQNKDVKNLLPLLNARCSLQTNSMKTCKKELRAFVSFESNRDMSLQTIQTLSIFLKSNFEFLRGNFHKAYKLLGSSPPPASVNSVWLRNGESLTTMFYNNLSVIHFYILKYNLGSYYLSKALEENDKAISTNHATLTPSKKGENKQRQTSSRNAKTLQMLNMNKKFELLYNAGLQLLFAGKPSAAFDCLITAVQAFYSNPRLWLRLAECCIQACCSLDKSEDIAPSSPSTTRGSKYQSSMIPYTVVGSGVHQKVIVHPITPNWTGTVSSVMPGPTLEFASVCLQNALTILAEAGISGLDMIEIKKNTKNEHASNKKTEISVPLSPVGSISGKELASLHAAILADSAFVALSLGNYLMAYEYAKVLLQLPNLSNRHRYVGKMYSAEALVSLDRISDAIQHLSTDTVAVFSDSSDGTKPIPHYPSNQRVQRPRGPLSTQCCFKSIQHTQGCMLFNQAVAHTLRSEFEKAQKLLFQFAALVPAQDVPSTAILLSVYVNLHSSGLRAALKILKLNSLPPHSRAFSNFQTVFRRQRSMRGRKQFSQSVMGSSPNGVNSKGFKRGGSRGSRSKSATTQPQYSNPGYGAVTPERVIKSSRSSKSDGSGSKTRRGRR